MNSLTSLDLSAGDVVWLVLWLAALFGSCWRIRVWAGRVSFWWTPRERPMQVDCAWCGETLRAGRQPVSHGICPLCKETLIEGGAPEPDRVGLS